MNRLTDINNIINNTRTINLSNLIEAAKTNAINNNTSYLHP
jgi:hypothetical protein